MRCAVYNCNENNNKVKPSVRFYSFPRENILRQQWIDFCQRKDIINTKTARICSAHFSPSDFERNMQFEMGLCTRNAFRLKPLTVPTVEPKSTSLVTSCSKRKQPKVKQQIVTSLKVQILNPSETSDIEAGIEIENQEAQEDNLSEGNLVYTESLETRIAFLSHEIESLRRENLCLQENEISSRQKIRSLQKLLKKSELDRTNIEDKVRRIFRNGRIDILKKSF